MDFSRYDKRKLLLLLIFSLLVVHTVAAQNFADMVENIPVLQGLTGDRIEKLYDDFWWLWDFAVYALILSTALKMGAEKALGSNAGKMGSIFAIVLSIGAVIAENKLGFNLKEFAALALAIGIFAFGLYMWRIVKGMGLGERGRLIMGILYLTIYALISPRLKGLRDAIGSMNWIISVADILAGVFAVLVVIDLFNFVKGLKGGRDGENVTPGSVAVATAEDQAALAEEARQRRLQQAEAEQEQRQMADLRAIQGLSERELENYGLIRQDFDKLINTLKKMEQPGRLDPTLVEAVREAVARIRFRGGKITELENQLRAKISELDQTQVNELKTLNALFAETKREVNDLVTAAKQKGIVVKGFNNKKWTAAKQKFEADATTRAAVQLRQTRTTLEAHAAAMGPLEQTFASNFNLAERALGANNIPGARTHLEEARRNINGIEAGLKQLKGTDVNRLQQLVRRKLIDLQAETKLGIMTTLGLRKEIPLLKRTAAAARGLKGAGGFLIKGVGKITKIRRGP